MTIAAVVEQAHAVVALRHINPSVRRYFEPRLFPTGVPIYWAFEGPILGLAGGVGRSDIDSESCFQKHMLLVPVYMHLEVNTWMCAINNNPLHNRARAESALDPRHRT